MGGGSRTKDKSSCWGENQAKGEKKNNSLTAAVQILKEASSHGFRLDQWMILTLSGCSLSGENEMQSG